jgi:secreted Zn-dependent insulinase-like peptidase
MYEQTFLMSNFSSSCLFDLYTLMLNSQLHAHADPGKASHISMDFFSIDTGLILKLTGFNQHLAKYLDILLRVIDDFQVNNDTLATWKQELKEQYSKELHNNQYLIKSYRRINLT